MLVKFNLNLGSLDAKALGLNFKACTEGAVVDVNDTQSEVLLRHGWASAVAELRKQELPQEVHAVPAAPSIAEPKPFKSATKSSDKPDDGFPKTGK